MKSSLPEEERELRYLQEDLDRKRRLPPPPKRLRDALQRLMARRGYGQKQLRRSRLEVWRQAAGNLARHSTPGQVRRSTLLVVVRNSLILQQLTFQREQILRRIAELAPDEKITQLQFRVGDVGRDSP